MSEKKFLLLLFLFTAITLLSNLGVFEANLMEARNFVSAREMLADGHWWKTTMNGLPRLEKPPLPTWITALFGSLSADFSIWFLRFPAAIMGILLVFWTYALSKNLMENTIQARWSAIVCASSLLFIQMSKTGTWDIYFVSFAIGSFMHLFRAVILKKKILLNSIAAGVLLGCSILSKGPVAGIMLVAFLLALVQLVGIKSLLNEWKSFLTIALLAGIIGFSWPLYNFLYLPEATEAVIAKESITWTTKHIKPFYFYLAFPIHMGIWLIPSLLILFPKLAKKYVGKSYYSLLIWLGITLFFFSLLPMKKERYLLPVIPVIAMLVGSFLIELVNTKTKGNKKVVFWSSFGLLALGFSLSPALLYFMQEKYPYALNLESYIGIALLFCTGLLIFRFLAQEKNKTVLLLSVLSVLLINVFLLPTLSDLYYKQPNFISPSRLMENHQLQNKVLYGIEESDMRVIHQIKSKLLPLSEAKKSVLKAPIYVLTSEKRKRVNEEFPNCIIEQIDSSGHHKTASHYGFVSYKISSILSE